MELTDCLRSSALVVAFLATAFMGSRTWILADIIASSAFGLGFLFFPHIVYGYQVVGSLDVIHVFALQCIGIVLVMTAAVNYLSRNSSNEGVFVSMHLSRFLTSLLLLQLMLWDHYLGSAKTRFNEQHLYFGILGCALWCFGHGIHLFTGVYASNRVVATKDKMSVHILIAILMIVMPAFYKLHAPLHGLEFVAIKFKVDALHLHIIQASAAFDFGFTVYLITALGFSSDYDKKSVFRGWMLGIGIVAVLFFYYQYQHSLLPRGGFIFDIAFLTLLFGNALCACYLGKETVKQKRR